MDGAQLPIFNADDLHAFATRGFVAVREAFPPSVARACVPAVWHEMHVRHGVDRADPATWTHKKVQLDAVWTKDDEGSSGPWGDVFTERLERAVGELLLGDDDQTVLPYGAGWWTVTFPGCFPADERWGADGRWHIDGCGARRHLFSHAIGLVAIFLFSDVRPDAGGTAVADGSHTVAAQVLLDAGLRGCTTAELAAAVLTRIEESGAPSDVTELTGAAGDVFLLHPLLLHARSKNLWRPSQAPAGGGAADSGVRVVAHPSVPLRRPLNLAAPRSVLERSIVDAVLAPWANDESKRTGAQRALAAITPEACAAFWARKRGDDDNREDDGGEGDDAVDVGSEEADEMARLMGFGGFKRAKWS